ncbi:hypothetical protein BGZ46_002611, partial [Entomortierella lignicola]
MACTTVRSAILEKAAPIATISRLVTKPIVSKTATSIERTTTQQQQSLESVSPLLSQESKTQQNSSFNSTSTTTSPTTTTTPVTTYTTSTSVPLKSTTSTQTVARPRFVPRNRRSIMSSGSDSNKWAILFPGQGSQFVGMGKDLYDTYAVARQVVDEADDALEGNLKHIMFEGSQEDLTRTENAQPAILTTSLAMLRVLESERGFKIEESCKHALGHSLGEYTALVATKAVTLKDAVKLV